ncbi:MAG TPA: hypothetical protein VF471_06745 [Pseudoxanthomonas sp.]
MGRTPRRHPAAGRKFPSRRQAHRRQRPQRIAAPPLARQRARTAQCRATRRTAGHRRPHRSGRPQPAQGRDGETGYGDRAGPRRNRSRAGARRRRDRPGRRRSRPQPPGAVPAHGTFRHQTSMSRRR